MVGQPGSACWGGRAPDAGMWVLSGRKQEAAGKAAWQKSTQCPAPAPPDPPYLLPAAPGSCHLLHNTLPFLPSLGAVGRCLGSGTQAVCQPWYLTPLVLLCGCH